MKLVAILLLFCVLKIDIFADCAGTGIWVFPNGANLQQNSIIILEGYAESQHVIRGLNKTHKIYLRSGYAIVNLNVREIYTGNFYVTQAILEPDQKLVAHKEYTLFIDSLPEYEKLGNYNSETNTYDPIKWTVLPGTDTQKPVIKTEPKEAGKILRHYGCGPAEYLLFEFEVDDASEIVTKAVVKNIELNMSTTYYVSSTKTSVDIGHGMCSGAFTFDKGDNYEIQFSFMDMSGNETKCEEKLKFTRPTEETTH